MFGLILVLFVTGLAIESLALALASLVSGLVFAFVMAIAYMRADGHTPEHHPAVDRIVDDTNP